jgi:DNA-binding beta-propeller fold protein YncE
MKPILRILGSALAIALPALAQQVDPNSDPVLTPEVQDAQNQLGPGPTDIGFTMGEPRSGAGLCEINIIVRNKTTGQSRTVKTRSYAVECNELDVQVRDSPLYIKISLKPKQQPPGGPGPFDPDTANDIRNFLNWLNGGGRSDVSLLNKIPLTGKGYQAADAIAARTAGSVPDVLDLPLAPPFSQGSDLDALNGCDPARPPTLYRVNHYASTVARMDGCPPTLTAKIRVTPDPLQAVLTPDGKTLIVTSFDNAITFIDTASNTVTRTLTTPSDFYPSGIDVTRDGLTAYVVSLDDFRPGMLIVDVLSRTILARIALPYEYPNGIFLTPDGTQAYITHPFGSEVIVFDIFTSSVAATLNIFEPHAVAFNRTGTRAYISSGTVVRVIDTSTLQQVDAIAVGGEPSNLELSADGQTLYIEDYATTKLYIYQLSTRTMTQVDTTVQSPGFTLN